MGILKLKAIIQVICSGWPQYHGRAYQKLEDSRLSSAVPTTIYTKIIRYRLHKKLQIIMSHRNYNCIFSTLLHDIAFYNN